MDDRKKLLSIMDGLWGCDGIEANNALHFIEAHFATKQMNITNQMKLEYNLEIRSLTTRIDVLTELIRGVEHKLDEANGEEGNLCLFCNADQYTGEVGIVHESECVIIQLRAAEGQ